MALSLPPTMEAIMDRLTYQAFLTPEEEGGYGVRFPDLDGCYTCGDDYADAVNMAADAAKTFVAALMKHGDPIPEAKRHDVPDGDDSVWVSFEVDPSYIVDGPVVSAAQAARELGLSAGRVTHMLNAGLLEGYREGRRTWVTTASIEARKAAPVASGRPRKAVAVA